jgi:AraC-like DNA-binding protein
VSYREHAPPQRLAALLACTWERAVETPHRQHVVPDGCVDLIWIAGRGLRVAGPDTGPHEQPLAAGAHAHGLRLRPGAAGAVLGLHAAEIRDGRAAIATIWGDAGRRLEERLAAGADPRAALLHAVAARHARPDALVTAAAHALDRPATRVATLAQALAISERQLHRRCEAAVGYGPKTLARVLRFQRLLRLAAPGHALADLALSAGYADQAHMTAEVTRLAGRSPVRFLKDRAQTKA